MLRLTAPLPLSALPPPPPRQVYTKPDRSTFSVCCGHLTDGKEDWAVLHGYSFGGVIDNKRECRYEHTARSSSHSRDTDSILFLRMF